MRKKVGIVLVVVLLLVAAFFLFGPQENRLDFSRFSFTAKAADGFSFLCINQAPIINMSDCPSIMNQSTADIDYQQSCVINITELDNESYTINYTPSITGVGVEIIPSNNTILLNASQDGVGPQNIIFYVTDTSGCVNGNATYNYSINFSDINDPPKLIASVPDVSFSSGTTRAPYSLYAFFEDPDLDALNFSVAGDNVITVTISAATGAVYYTSTGCGSDYLLFTATDPYNASTTSNIVLVQSICAPVGSQDEDSGGSSGGGGSSSSNYICTPKWKCDDWSQCFINGTRFKRCIDLNGCKEKDYIRYFWENCTYIPTCNDEIQNANETGIDCGGACPRCGTCIDGVQNGAEQGIDCGGDCTACHDCFNGIQDWDELGVDCGGDFCEPCMTCDDGIQNQGETGIDCGGPCATCSILEIPSFIKHRDNVLRLLLVLAIALTILIILVKIYHKRIRELLARLGWRLTAATRKTILLTAKAKQELLQELATIDKNLQEKGIGERTTENLLSLAHRYLGESLHIGKVFNEQDVHAATKKRMHSTILRDVFVSFHKKISSLERVDTPQSIPSLRLIIEEVRQLIFQTAIVEKEDLLSDVEELPLKGDTMQKVTTCLHNIHIALQFEESLVAKKHYLTLLKHYESLSEVEKSKVYDDSIRTFAEIRYQLSWKKE